MKTQKLSNLTVLLLRYQKYRKAEDYQELYNGILEYAYKFPIVLSKKNHEHRGDFALYIEPKIPFLIDRFQYDSVALEGYLYRTFRGQFCSYIKEFNKMEFCTKEYSKWCNYRILDLPAVVEEIPEGYDTYIMTEFTQFLRKIEDIIEAFTNSRHYEVFCRRMWIFLLKYSSMLEVDRIIELAKKIGVRLEEAKRVNEALSEDREVLRLKKIDSYNDCMYLFSKYVNKELHYNEMASYMTIYEKETYLSGIGELKEKYHTKLKAFFDKSFCISNKRLSVVLDIPKGSIDSSIYHFRKMCNKIARKVELDK